MKQRLEAVKDIYNRITSHKLTVYAAQATLFVIISALPLTMLIIGLIKYIIPFDIYDVVNAVHSFVPKDFYPTADVLIGEIFTGSGASVISLSTIAVMWSASKGMMALVQGVESVYETGEKRGYIKTRLYAFVYTVVFIAVITATLLIFVAGRYFVGLTARNFQAAAAVLEIITDFPVVIYIAMLTFIFAVLYKMLPGKGFTFVNQLPGALFSALGWVIFSAGYSFYISRFANYSYIYGSLTAVVLSMLWLYFCMNIFLLGAEVNCLLKERKEKYVER